MAAAPPVVAPVAPALTPIHQVLEWIGFLDNAHRNAICNEGGFDDLSGFIGVTETDLRDMAESFEKRSAANGRITFGMRRTKWLVGVMHWVQDFDRCSQVPTINGINDADAMKAALTVAIERAATRKVEADQVDTVSKAADPGKFKDERRWPDWEPAFVNYLSTIPGVYGVPLSYVVRVNENPDFATDFGNDFQAKMVACARLNGNFFKADARKVHQLLKNFLVTETAEQWIQHLSRHADGRRDMAALRDHYAGEGNASRRIATADRMREGLHYRSERSMPFTSFLDRLQKMFNIYADEGEAYSEGAKIRELLKRVQHSQLQDTVKALEVRFDMDGLTYTQAANHLTAAVSKLAEFQTTRKVSEIGADRLRGGGLSAKKSKAPTKGVFMPDGSIFTGFYKNWKDLSNDDKDKVMEERKRKNKSGASSRKNNKRKASELSSIVDSLSEVKRQIASLSSKDECKECEDASDKNKVPDDAGNMFGGRRERLSKKD